MFAAVENIRKKVREHRFFALGVVAAVVLGVTCLVVFMILGLLKDMKTVAEKPEKAKPVIEESEKSPAGEKEKYADVVKVAGIETAPEPELMRWPAVGSVEKAFGFAYSETFNDLRFHAGIDIMLPVGAKVCAALSGTVTCREGDRGKGKEVVIEHDGGLVTAYLGIKPEEDINGRSVSSGDIIGRVDISPPFEGEMEPHLHFTVYENEKSVDPLKYLK